MLPYRCQGNAVTKKEQKLKQLSFPFPLSMSARRQSPVLTNAANLRYKSGAYDEIINYLRYVGSGLSIRKINKFGTELAAEAVRDMRILGIIRIGNSGADRVIIFNKSTPL